MQHYLFRCLVIGFHSQPGTDLWRSDISRVSQLMHLHSSVRNVASKEVTFTLHCDLVGPSNCLSTEWLSCMSCCFAIWKKKIKLNYILLAWKKWTFSKWKMMMISVFALTEKFLCHFVLKWNFWCCLQGYSHPERCDLVDNLKINKCDYANITSPKSEMRYDKVKINSCSIYWYCNDENAHTVL